MKKTIEEIILNYRKQCGLCDGKLLKTCDCHKTLKHLRKALSTAYQKGCEDMKLDIYKRMECMQTMYGTTDTRSALKVLKGIDFINNKTP